MKTLNKLFKKNSSWSEEIRSSDPKFFSRLSQQQAPEYLWIGCSDSRVPANQIVGLDPGELFVHRNVSNLVIHTDLNCLSVMQFAVESLKVKHIIVCGHYGCGGIKAALDNSELGLITNWLRHIQDIMHLYQDELSSIADPKKRCDRLCELNVIHQVINVCRTTIVQDAWNRNQEISVHGWVYALKDGLLKDLEMCIGGQDDLDKAVSDRAIARQQASV